MNINKLIEETKALAYKSIISQIGSIPRSTTHALSTLFDFPWHQYIDLKKRYTKKELIELNGSFSLQCGFGQIVLALILIETNHPKAHVSIAEVLVDRYHKVIIDKLYDENFIVKNKREKLALDLLSCEEPHLVLLVNGIQFDLMTWLTGKMLTHDSIEEFSPWPAITASLEVNEALKFDDPNLIHFYLDRAEKICPDMTLVMQTKAGYFFCVEKRDEFFRLADKVFWHRPLARMLFVVSEEGIDPSWRNVLKDFYPPEVIKILKQEDDEVFKDANQYPDTENITDRSPGLLTNDELSDLIKTELADDEVAKFINDYIFVFQNYIRTTSIGMIMQPISNGLCYTFIPRPRL